MELSASPWLFAIVGGAVLLGIAIAYGAVKSSHASRRQRDAAEEGARKMYHKDDADRDG